MDQTNVLMVVDTPETARKITPYVYPIRVCSKLANLGGNPFEVIIVATSARTTDESNWINNILTEMLRPGGKIIHTA